VVHGDEAGRILAKTKGEGKAAILAPKMRKRRKRVDNICVCFKLSLKEKTKAGEDPWIKPYI